MKTRRIFLAVATAFLFSIHSSAPAAEVTVEEQAAGPVAEEQYKGNNPYVVSPRGGRLAVVLLKGSRAVVIVDGVEGPKFDDIIVPSANAIDMRPVWKASQQGAPWPSPGLVTFSSDGKRYAYIGRLAQEWVIMADGKEVVRVPMAGTAAVNAGFGQLREDIRLAFTGDDGKHLMFARSVFEGYELWVDGQRMPAFFQSGGGGTEGTVDPVSSRDGSRFAYAGLADKKRVLIVDGKPAGYLGGELQFSADGKVLYAINRENPSEHVALANGRPVARAPQIAQIYAAPAGNRLIAVAADASGKYYCIVDGKKVDATESVLAPGATVPVVIFSPDGQRYAVPVFAGPQECYVVVDGKRGQRYEGLIPVAPEQSMGFSPDSKRFAYIANTGGKSFVVVDGESDGFATSPFASFMFSPDGKRVAVWGQRQTGPALYIDGKAERTTDMPNFATFQFSPDGRRYAYTGRNGAIYLDGKHAGLAGEEFAFSPDSQHFAAKGMSQATDYRPGPFATAGKMGLYLDGALIHAHGGPRNSSI